MSRPPRQSPTQPRQAAIAGPGSIPPPGQASPALRRTGPRKRWLDKERSLTLGATKCDASRPATPGPTRICYWTDTHVWPAGGRPMARPDG